MGFFLVQGKEGLMAVAEKTEVCDADEKVIEMELERLRTFENHPFVYSDSTAPCARSFKTTLTEDENHLHGNCTTA